ncbi:MAG: PAS domain-containing protein [Kiritimatiellae bacterium]|jgi:two-component system cell cycle sensor histidine kinase/response regulator CckA|nr:PAS domain-containing protein [Kiritimatiellia bacterium]
MKELEDLRARLDEAESTLNAIRNGEADAPLVTGQTGKQVHTLRAYRHRSESMRLAGIPGENPNPVIRVSVLGILQYANVAAETIFPLLGVKKIGDTVNGEWQKHIDRAVTEGYPVVIAFQATGHTFDATLAPVTEEKYVNLYVRDVTEQRRVERAPRESEEEFRSLAEAMPQIVWVTRPDGWCTYINQQWVEYTGLTLEESLGLGWNAPFHPDDQQRVWDVWQYAIQNSGTYTLECRLRRFDGGYRWWLIRGVPLLNKHGEILKWFGTCTDIEEFKQATLALEESEKVLMEAQSIAQLGNYVLDITSDRWKSSVVMDEIFGIDTGYDHTTEGWLALIHPDDRAMMSDYLKNEVIGNRKPFNKEYRIIRQNDRAERWIQGMGRLELDGADAPVKLVGTIQDNTEFRQAETERLHLQTQLKQSQKLDSVGRLAGGVAHDFNNMLQVILGYTELVLKDVVPSDPSFDNLVQIQHAAERSGALTRQLLAFARQQPITPKVLNLNDEISDMLKMLRRLIREEVEILWRPGTDLNLVKLDPIQIDQILVNLCVNAQDAVTDNGRISIETGNVSIDETYCAGHTEALPGPYVVLTVSDNGCGIDKGIIENIFEPFFTTKKTGKGTGLGLATVYGIVKQNKGFMYVYSEVGQGTVFKIHLPQTAPVPEGIVENTASSLPNAHGVTILLVEDESSLRSVYNLFLRSLGYTVLTAETPAEALKLFSQQPEDIQLLLTDVVMPGMNGMQLSKEIHAVNPAVKVLFMSGYSADIIADHGVLDQDVAFIPKPFSCSEMAQKLQETMGLHEPQHSKK